MRKLAADQEIDERIVQMFFENYDEIKNACLAEVGKHTDDWEHLI